MKSGRCINENVLEWAYKKRLIGLPPKKPPYQKEMEKAQPRITPVTPSESVGQRQRPRRPDKQLYVPRARRGDASSGDETTQSDEKLLSSSPQSARTMPEVSDKKFPNTRIHLTSVENSKSVQENPSRRTIEYLNRTLRNDVLKNLPDVVPVERNKIRSIAANKNDPCERNVLQKSMPGDNSRVYCSRKSSDCKPCDLVNVKTDDKKPIVRISSVRSTITSKEAVPVCAKNLQKSSLSMKPNNVSHVTHARKLSLCNNATKSPLEGKESVESVSSNRTTSKSNVIERKNVQKPLSSMKISDKIKHSVEQTRKLSLSNQKARRSPVEQIKSGRESIDSVTSVDSTGETKDVCERISLQISPAFVKSSEDNYTYTRNSYLNNDKAHKFHLASVNAEDEELRSNTSSIRARSNQKHPENQKNAEISIENACTDVIHNESSHSDREPLDQVHLNAKKSVGNLCLNHEVKIHLSENKDDQESTVCSKFSDNLHLQILKERTYITLSEIPIKEVKVNADLGDKELCKNDILSCIPSTITSGSLQKPCAVTEKDCHLFETLVDADVRAGCDCSTVIAGVYTSHADNLLLLQNSSSGNSYVIPFQGTSEKENVVHESQLIDINRDAEVLSQSYSLENLQTMQEKEISVNVEDHDDHVESNFLFKPTPHHKLEDNEFHTSESVSPAGQHCDKDELHPVESGFLINPTMHHELEDNKEFHTSESVSPAGQHFDEDELHPVESGFLIKPTTHHELEDNEEFHTSESIIPAGRHFDEDKLHSVKSGFLIKPTTHHELEDNEEFHTSESIIPAGQHFDEDELHPVESGFLINPTMHHELEDNEEFHTSESVSLTGQHFNEDLFNPEDSLDPNKTEEDSWDSLFDENGDCLNPTVMTELTDTLGKVDIHKSKYDYLEFRPQDPDLSGEEFSHIVELYDFPAEFKTQDLMSTLSTFRERGFNIKWIDDTHALAVFSSSIAATEALSIQHPLVKVRPLSQAISGSKWKAKRFSDDLLPYKPRPQTTASLARRLVSGALGLRVSISKEQRDQERQRLQQAKERKRQVAKQKQDVWDGAVK